MKVKHKSGTHFNTGGNQKQKHRIFMLRERQSRLHNTVKSANDTSGLVTKVLLIRTCSLCTLTLAEHWASICSEPRPTFNINLQYGTHFLQCHSSYLYPICACVFLFCLRLFFFHIFASPENTSSFKFSL